MSWNSKEFNRYYKEYIEGVDLSCIEFKTFTYDELLVFLKQYYYDHESNKFVSWEPDGIMSPFGMYYLDFVAYSSDLSYLLGLVDNSKGGKTIAFCMIYDNDYGAIDEINNKVGYIDKAETNFFFRNKGVLKKSLNHIREIFKNYDILVLSPESINGKEISISKRVEELFGGTPKVIDEEEYISKLSQKQKW